MSLSIAAGPALYAQASEPADTARAVAVDSTTAPPIPAPADTVAPTVSAPVAADALSVVVGLEEKRRAAMVAADTRTLASIIAADATYVHSTGMMQKRDELLRLLDNQTVRYLSFDVEKTSYRVYGDTVVGTGVQRIGVMSGGKSVTIHSRYTVIYTMRDGAEQLVAYQSTPLPQMTPKQ